MTTLEEIDKEIRSVLDPIHRDTRECINIARPALPDLHAVVRTLTYSIENSIYVATHQIIFNENNQLG